MKNILFLSLIFFSRSLNAQVEVLHTSITVPDSAVVFFRFYNQMEIINIEIDSTFYATFQGDTIQLDYNVFTLFPKTTQSDTLKIVHNNQLIYSKKLDIIRGTNQMVVLGDIRDSVTTLKELRNNKALLLIYENPLLVSCSQVTDWCASIIKPNGKILKYAPSYRKITDKQWKKFEEGKYFRNSSKWNGGGPNTISLKVIKKIRIGDVLSIDLVTLSCPSCISRRFSPDLRLKIIR